MRANELTQAKGGTRLTRPATPFDMLQQQIDRVFETFSSWDGGMPAVAFSPSMEVAETPEAVEITTELPGMDEKDVEISVADGVLTIRGEKKEEKEEKKKSYRLIERSYGSFERSLALPRSVDTGAVNATLTKGVLRIVLPKTAEAKAQQIKITKA
jgi:HSP20 family protein